MENYILDPIRARVYVIIYLRVNSEDFLAQMIQFFNFHPTRRSEIEYG